METLQAKFRDKETPSLPPISPTNSTSSTTTSGAASKNGGAPAAHVAPSSPAPPTPKPISRSIDANPYPTTFVQADTSSFKQVVQMLTGSADTAAKHAAAPPLAKNPLPPAAAAGAKATGLKKPAFKLYERRSGLKSLKMINPLIPSFVGSNPELPAGGGSAGFSPRKQPAILSPSVLDFPSLALSPVTPLIPDPFNRSPPANSAARPAAMSPEDRAIAEKGFYLHPSPRGPEPPRLLPLFPETSPRLSSAPASRTST